MNSKSNLAFDSTLAKGIFECLGKLWDDTTHSDFSVNVENRVFNCHRLILGTYSDFFEALFRSGMKESLSASVVIKDIKAETFEMLMQVVYKSINVLTPKNMFDIWHAANMLQMQFLINFSEDFVMSHISSKNLMEVYRNANSLGSEKVLFAALEVMAETFSKFRQSEEFLEISHHDLLLILKRKSLNIITDDLVDAILKWVASEARVMTSKDASDGRRQILDTPQQQQPNSNLDALPESRMKHLGSLLEAAKLGMASDACLALLLKHEIVRKCNTALCVVSSIAALRIEPNHYNNIVRQSGHPIEPYVNLKSCSPAVPANDYVNTCRPPHCNPGRRALPKPCELLPTPDSPFIARRSNASKTSHASGGSTSPSLHSPSAHLPRTSSPSPVPSNTVPKSCHLPPAHPPNISSQSPVPSDTDSFPTQQSMFSSVLRSLSTTRSSSPVTTNMQASTSSLFSTSYSSTSDYLSLSPTCSPSNLSPQASPKQSTISNNSPTCCAQVTPYINIPPVPHKSSSSYHNDLASTHRYSPSTSKKPVTNIKHSTPPQITDAASRNQVLNQQRLSPSSNSSDAHRTPHSHHHF